MKHLRKLLKLIWFGLFYIKEVISSNLRVAIDILTPTHLMKPEVLEIDVSRLTPFQLLVASNLISMTPGTLSMDVADDILYIHSMYCDDPQADAKLLEKNYITRVQDVF